MSLRSKVCDLIHSRPGITELELATIIYGPGMDKGQVNRMCRQLVDEGLVMRAGKGGNFDPYKYRWSRLGQARCAGRMGNQQQPSM